MREGFNSDAERDTALVDETNRLNRDALFKLICEHQLFIRHKELDKWRPTKQITGVIEGLESLGTLLIVATDGLQAYFMQQNKQLILGHIQRFHWDNPEVQLVPYRKDDGTIGWFKSVKEYGAPSALFQKPSTAKYTPQKPKRLSLVERALEMLRGTTK